MKAFKPKWVKSDYIYYEVTSLRLGGLQLMRMKPLIIDISRILRLTRLFLKDVKLEATKPKWVISILNIIGVNSLILGGLQLFHISFIVHIQVIYFWYVWFLWIVIDGKFYNKSLSNKIVINKVLSFFKNKINTN